MTLPRSGLRQRIRTRTKEAALRVLGEHTTRLLLRLRYVVPMIRRFGARDGLLLSWRMLWPRRGLVEVKVPGYDEPIVLRAASSDIPTFEQMLVFEEYKLAALDPSPALIIDAGANIGLSARYFAQRYPTARILAIEPDPSNYELLRRNTRRCPNVTPVKAALWNSSDRLAIANPDAEKWAIRVEPSSLGGVRAVTVPELLEQASLGHVDILKVDIEGAECEVFDATAAAWVQRVGVFMIELHDDIRPGCSAAFYAATKGLGYPESRSGEKVVLVNPRAGKSQLG